MVSDNEIARIFQIPVRMMQKWKNSNDYRYLIYKYLKLADRNEIAAFFNNLSTSRNRESPHLIPLYFIYKKDFMLKISRETRKIVSLATRKGGHHIHGNHLFLWAEKYISAGSSDKESFGNIGGGSASSRIPLSKIVDNADAIAPYSIFSIDEDKNVLYIELCGKIQEKAPLKKKVVNLKASLKEKYTLKHMLFITNEKELPRFLRVMNGEYEGVKFWNVPMERAAKNIFNAKKIIFVPNNLEIPKPIKMESLADKIETSLLNQMTEIYENYPYAYEMNEQDGTYKDAKFFCKTIFEFSKKIKKKSGDLYVDIDDLHIKLFSKDVRKEMEQLLEFALHEQYGADGDDDGWKKNFDYAAAHLHRIFAGFFLKMDAVTTEYWFENFETVEEKFDAYLKREAKKYYENIFLPQTEPSQAIPDEVKKIMMEEREMYYAENFPGDFPATNTGQAKQTEENDGKI
ncbi:hypothetical protein [Hydrogenimonas sp.]